MLVCRGEIALRHCVWGDQSLGVAFRLSPKFFHCHNRSHVCCAVEVSQAAILHFLLDGSRSFVVPTDKHIVYFDVRADAENMA
jgi:hypothetical protein